MKFSKPKIDVSEIKDISLEEFQRLAQEANDKEIEWAKTYQTLNYLERMRKEFFARLCNETNEKTIAQSVNTALSKDDWQTFVVGLCAAENMEIEAKAKKDVAIRNWETYRTVISLKKQEMNRI